MGFFRGRQHREFVACGSCGSPSVHPRYLVGGFIPHVNDNAQIYECDACGHQGPHLSFPTEEDRRSFQDSLRHPPRRPDGDFQGPIPIVPMDTRPGIQGSGRIPGLRSPRVTDVLWEGGRLVRGRYSENFHDYLDACGGSPRGHERILLMDLPALEGGEPDFSTLKDLIKGKTQVWLEMGVQRREDVMDGLILDAERVLLGTLTVRGLQLFREAYDMADGCLPCLYLSGGRIMGPGPSDMEPVAMSKALAALGFGALGVIDLDRLGRYSGFSRELADRFAAVNAEVYLGGGIREGDLDALKRLGMAGGFLDPYTPDIDRRLRGRRRDEAEVGFHPTVRPKPRSTSVPSA
jgi:uncharacterized protein related to proFAR isomerase